MRSMCRRNATCEARPPRRAFPPLSTGPSLKTERFQRGRSCGTEGNPVRGAPARLHRHKLLVRGGSGGRRAAWNPRRPPAAFGSFPLRERNSCVRRRTKLPQAAPSSPVRAPPIHDPKQTSMPSVQHPKRKAPAISAGASAAPSALPILIPPRHDDLAAVLTQQLNQISRFQPYRCGIFVRMYAHKP